MLDLSSLDDPRDHKAGAAGLLLLDDGSVHLVMMCEDCGSAHPVRRLARHERPHDVRKAQKAVRWLCEKYGEAFRALRLGPDSPDLRG